MCACVRLGALVGIGVCLVSACASVDCVKSSRKRAGGRMGTFKYICAGDVSDLGASVCAFRRW